MAYAHTNSKGATYYLHSNGKMFYFAKARRVQRRRDENGHACSQEEPAGTRC